MKSLIVGAATVVISIWALPALVGNGYEYIFSFSALTLLTTFTTAYNRTKRTSVAVSIAALCTLLTVGGGIALLYAICSRWCS